jgi:hypothetical protein
MGIFYAQTQTKPRENPDQTQANTGFELRFFRGLFTVFLVSSISCH